MEVKNKNYCSQEVRDTSNPCVSLGSFRLPAVNFWCMSYPGLFRIDSDKNEIRSTWISSQSWIVLPSPRFWVSNGNCQSERERGRCGSWAEVCQQRDACVHTTCHRVRSTRGWKGCCWGGPWRIFLAAGGGGWDGGGTVGGERKFGIRIYAERRIDRTWSSCLWTQKRKSAQSQILSVGNCKNDGVLEKGKGEQLESGEKESLFFFLM